MKKTDQRYRSKQKKKIEPGSNITLPDKEKYPFLPLLLVFCLPVLLNLQTVTYGFTNFDDDLIILRNLDFLSRPDHILDAFRTDAFLNHSSHFYRPLQIVTYMIDISCSGKDHAWMFHLTNVLLAGLSSCLLYLFLKRFPIPPKKAFWAALIFGVHPLFVSSVSWIPARGDLLLTFFVLLSFLFFIEYLEKKKKIFLLAHWAAFTFALFCKETAALLPLLIIGYYFIFCREDHARKKYLPVLLSWLITLVSWYFLRAAAIGNYSSPGEETGLTAVMSNLRSLPEAFSKFFLPSDTEPVPGFSIFKTISGIVIILLLILLFFKNKERKITERSFGLAWFLLFIFPPMLYKHKYLDYLDHRFYLPMIGVLLFLLFVTPEKWIRKSVIPFLLVLFLGSFTFIKSAPYASPLKFYNAVITGNTGPVFAFLNRGLYKKNNKDLQGAIDDYTRAIELKPDFAEAFNNRGEAYFYLRKYENAISDYSRAISLKPGNAGGYYNRGLAYENNDQFEEAVKDYSRAIELDPDISTAYYNRGLVYMNQKVFDKAIEDFSHVIKIDPANTDAYYNRGFSYCRSGLFEKAIADLSKAIELKPDHASAYNNRGGAYFSLGMTEQACLDFQKAKELGSKDAEENISRFCHGNSE
jgi:tetratricopeptide (TPR) repeat protein